MATSCVLQNYIPDGPLQEVRRILYGENMGESVQKLSLCVAQNSDDTLDIQGYKFSAKS